MVKHLPTVRETWVRSLGWEDLLKKEMATYSSKSMPGKFHGLRSLVGYSPQDCKKSDTTERLHFQVTFLARIFLGFQLSVTGYSLSNI